MSLSEKNEDKDPNEDKLELVRYKIPITMAFITHSCCHNLDICGRIHCIYPTQIVS